MNRTTATGLGGGIGRRAGFKIQWLQDRVGSIPTQGTTNQKMVNRERAPKRKLAFFLEWSEAIFIFGFHSLPAYGGRSLKGTLALANESRQK